MAAPSGHLEGKRNIGMANGERVNARPAFRGMAALCSALLGFAVIGAEAGGQENFVPGSGRADARLVRVGPEASQLSFAPTVGVALADYQTTIGRAESLVFDWVALDGSIPDDLKDEAHPLRADTQAPEECWTRERFLPADPPANLTTQRVTAGPEGPWGASEFLLEGFDIPGVVEIKGGVARAMARLEGTVRTATATTDIPEVSLGSGAVVLSGLHWTATQRTDGDGAPQVEGGFTIEALRVLEQEIELPEQIHGLAEAINDVLEPLGIGIQLPVLDLQAGIARITPLGVNVFPSELRKDIIGPFVGAFDENLRQLLIDEGLEVGDIRTGLFPLGERIDETTGAAEEGGIAEGTRDVEFVGCPGDPQPEPEGEEGSPVPAMPFDGAVSIGDIVLGALGGTGGARVHIGGVLAFTEGERFDDPFREPLPFEPIQPRIEEIPGVPGTPGSPGILPEEQLVAAPPQAGPVRGTEPGSRGGLAVLVGAVGVALALALAGADWLYIRRYRAVLPVGPKGG